MFAALDNPEVFNVMIDMINAKYAIDMNYEDVRTMARKILRTEHDFNLTAGFTNKHDRLPEFFEEPCPPHNIAWDFSDEEIDSFWHI